MCMYNVSVKSSLSNDFKIKITGISAPLNVILKQLIIKSNLDSKLICTG